MLQSGPRRLAPYPKPKVVRISYPKLDPLLSSSMRQDSFKYITRLELKSWQTFLAIKRCERTKIGKVIKRSRSSFYKLAHTCRAHKQIIYLMLSYAPLLFGAVILKMKPVMLTIYLHKEALLSEIFYRLILSR